MYNNAFKCYSISILILIYLRNIIYYVNCIEYNIVIVNINTTVGTESKLSIESLLPETHWINGLN